MRRDEATPNTTCDSVVFFVAGDEEGPPAFAARWIAARSGAWTAREGVRGVGVLGLGVWREGRRWWGRRRRRERSGRAISSARRGAKGSPCDGVAMDAGGEVEGTNKEGKEREGNQPSRLVTSGIQFKS